MITSERCDSCVECWANEQTSDDKESKSVRSEESSKQISQYRRTTVKWSKIQNYAKQIHKINTHLRTINTSLPGKIINQFIFNMLPVYIKYKLLIICPESFQYLCNK